MHSPPRAALPASLLFLAMSGCFGTDDAERTRLENSHGKADAAEFRFRLTESSPVAGMSVICDGAQGCDGWIELSLRSPDACTLLDDPRCGIGQMAPATLELATLTLRSDSEGERRLPLTIETFDGSFVSASVAVAFQAGPGEFIDLEIERVASAPDVTLGVFADWVDRSAPPAGELEAFLATVEGMSFEEISTGYPGYRSYMLRYEQPLDHDDPAAGTFLQRATLHHKDVGAPMVLFTSGYALFSEDYLSELTESMGANQLDTEQRFFGESFPADPSTLTDDDWAHVTIEQAAADHHRFVEALKPFYDGSWLSTGHSKGGMTSIYHRRFYPDDVDATVPYVAPISFAQADPRYAPHLDQIGTDDCRGRVRALQREALERFDVIQPSVQEDAESFGLTFSNEGGHAAAFEEAIEWVEWSYWQSYGSNDCSWMRTVEELEAMSDEDIEWEITGWAGYGWADTTDFDVWSGTYYFQAARELGWQGLSTAHFGDLVRYPAVPWPVPPGTSPVYDDAVAMQDVQQWVLDQGSELAFIYGEFDPWTGGAFDVREDQLLVKAPAMNHGATIRDLTDGDRAQILDAIELWMGVRPDIGPQFRPSRAQLPAHLHNTPTVRRTGPVRY